MELDRDELELAVDELEYRSERPLPYECGMLRQLIKEYFALKKLHKRALENWRITSGALREYEEKYGELE